MKLRSRLLLDYYFGGFLHATLKIPALLLGRLLRRDHDLSNCRDIAILKLLGGGSLVIAYPALLALRRLPNLRKLVLVTTPGIAPFGEALDIFDEIIVIRDNASLPALAFDSLRALRRLSFIDALIDLEIHSRLTTVFALLSSARNRIGFFTHISFWRRHLNTHLLFCNVSNGIYNFYDQIATLFGTVPVDQDECAREFRATVGDSGLPAGRTRFALAPTCSGLSGERKLWPDEWLRILTLRLAPKEIGNAEVHLLGAPSDRAKLEEMKALFERSFPELNAVHNHAGTTTLIESVRILSDMDEVLCIDSALLHFSRLLGRPTISFWGPTDPRTLLRPRRAGLDEIHYAKIPCSPCVHMSMQAPCRGNNICMRLAVDPEADVSHNQPWVLTAERTKAGKR